MRLLVFGLLVLLLFGCAQKAPAEPVSQPAAPAQESPAPVVDAPAVENGSEAVSPPPAEPPPAAQEEDIPVESFDIAAKDYAFTPSTITVQKGSRVRIKVTSLDRTYGFAIMDFGVNQLVQAKESAVVSFIAGKAGEFEIKNTHISTGRAYDMKGTLVVEG